MSGPPGSAVNMQMFVCIPGSLPEASRRPRSPVLPISPATSVLPPSLAHLQVPPSIPPISQGLARYAHPAALITIRPSPYSDRRIPYPDIGLTVLYCVFACALAIPSRTIALCILPFPPSPHSPPSPTAGGLTSTSTPEREKLELSSRVKSSHHPRYTTNSGGPPRQITIATFARLSVHPLPPAPHRPASGRDSCAAAEFRRCLRLVPFHRACSRPRLGLTRRCVHCRPPLPRQHRSQPASRRQPSDGKAFSRY